MDIGNWLRGLDLGQYEAAFRGNEIDDTVLLTLTTEDLKDLGVTIVGHRRKLLDAVAALRAEATGKAPLASAADTRTDTAERRQVTVMFCDIVGSTALAARMDPEDLREVIAAYHKCAAETVRRFGGFVSQYLGDGVLVYFGYPQAHEDDAERAVRAGRALIAELAALQSCATLQTRIGIATGVVVVGDIVDAGGSQERGIIGETPNLAARLQGIALPNSIIIAESTRRLLGDLFVLRDLGTNDLKGVTGAVNAFGVLRDASVESRFEALRGGGLTNLVGREEELELLLRRWVRVVSGEGQVALLSGEAGIGKSRLTAALMERLACEPHTRLRYFCSPQHSDSALYPIISQLERAAGLAHDDNPQQKLDKLERVLAQTAASAQEGALFAELLSLPNDGRYPALDLVPQQRRQRTLEALDAQMEALARQNPILMIFEDAHWTDPTSLELLGRVVNRIADHRILLIVTSRPEFNPPWTGLAQVSAMTINRLAKRDVDTMIEQVLGDKTLPARIRDEIVERTDGIPLFVEEVTKAVLEVGSEGAGRQIAAIPSLAQAVPPSLHASLMARLDRLGAAKAVAQIGSAIGREFSHALLTVVIHKSEADLNAALDRLIQSGLLFRQGIPPHATYLFKHALVQDAAYGTLLREPRRALHARVAGILESQFPEVVDTQPEILAHHFTQAGLGNRAIDFWRVAGQRALSRSANVEAIAHLTNALALTQSLPAGAERDERELTLQLALGPALMATRGYGAPVVEQAYARARELCRNLSSGPILFAALRGLWEHYELRARMDSASEIASEVFNIAERSGDRSLLLIANDVVGDTSLWAGNFAAAVAHTQRAIELYDPKQDRQLALAHGGYDPTMACRVFGAHALWYLGYPDRALRQCQDALIFARALDHPPTLAFESQIALHHCLRGEAGSAEAHAQAAVDLALRHDFKFWLGHATISHGWAVAIQGRAEGLDEIVRGIDAYRATGAELECSVWAAMLADALLRHGRIEEARTVIADALTKVADTGVRLHLAEMHRLHGESLVRLCAPPNEAQAAFRRAVDVAQGQGAKLLELRAAVSMARLQRDQGARNEARELLALVHEWFTEGIDTPDLKDAKVLLDEVAR
jgi:class 3 adenylate cyclase/predicted ATPase